MKKMSIPLYISRTFVFLLLFACRCGQTGGIVISVENPLPLVRRDAVVSIPFRQIQDRIEEPIKHLRVLDMSGEEIISQIMDENEDGKPDVLLFQCFFGPKMTRLFRVKATNSPGKEWNSRVHTAFVPHGMEDFNWENDRIGYRFYGQARLVEGVSSGIDVWCKRVPYRMVEKWYDPNINYHEDRGEGADYYPVKATRGCGGTSLLAGDSLVSSGPFIKWRVVAEGPIRTVFQLEFPELVIGGKTLSEVKRVTMDAGSHLSRFELTYQSEDCQSLPFVIGIADHKESIYTFDEERSLMYTWEPLGDGKGELGCAVIMEDASCISDFRHLQGHYMLIAEAEPGTPVVYFAGASWSEYGDVRNAEDWDAYLDAWYRKMENPLIVKYNE
jgi:pectinesterase